MIITTLKLHNLKFFINVVIVKISLRAISCYGWMDYGSVGGRTDRQVSCLKTAQSY